MLRLELAPAPRLANTANTANTASAGRAAAAAPRSGLVDALKLVASQLIVWHHIVRYSPMAEQLAPAWPRLRTFLADDARAAVQVFLVIGGYLAAQGLSQRARSVPRALLERYLRLVPMFAVALLCVLAASALLPRGRWPDWVTPWPTPGAFVAQLLLLHDVLGLPSLSAGAWYVAIDFQLCALLTMAAALLRRDAGQPPWRTPLPWLVAALSLLSLWRFNRDPALEAWAPYFFGAYGLGALAAWSRHSRTMAALFAAVCALQLLDAWLEPRPRVLVACACAIALATLASRGRARPVPALGRWSDASYGVFVIHYAVIVATSALWLRLGGSPSAAAAWLALLLTWAASLGAGAALHRHVGGPAAKAGLRRAAAVRVWCQSRRSSTSRAAKTSSTPPLPR